ncbi:hypothetical protein HOLleu_30918 [Holothuria leucospilota]|uniref:Uncharacterized protein n=1 Tax=Holothuria leucospilota TaxID=206669 RepID=A0A9Q1BL30_HOLLE|nr:hypothetical protein HOLleu_30918 [Holothuria leucospilota]
MATGHILPGYGNPVSKFRSKSADPTMSGNRYRRGWKQDYHSKEELLAIQNAARLAWEEEVKEWDKTPDIKPTTYSHSFYAKSHIAAEEQPVVRPLSPTRRNRPHPPEVFLKCRLHHVPGYHNTHVPQGQELGSVEGFMYPDPTVKEEVYVVDALCPEAERQDRSQLRRKYIGRPNTADVLRFKDSKVKNAFQDPWEAQAAEAWMKLANERDRKNVERVIERSQPMYQRKQTPVRLTKSASAYGASTRRYLRATGAEESKSVDKLWDTLTSRPKSGLPMSGPHFHITDYSNIHNNKITINPKFTRADFTIHPEFYP